MRKIFIILGVVIIILAGGMYYLWAHANDDAVVNEKAQADLQNKWADDYANNGTANPTNVSSNTNSNQNIMTKTYAKPFALNIDVNKTYTATLHTSEGDIVIALNAKATPNTVNNFVNLAKDGFYDNTVFHRAIKGFMIQGGDPKGDGTGGPGYRFADEKISGEYKRGTVAMANAGPNTNDSQFFIMHADYALPKNYVIFGNVTSGLDVVDKIATAPVTMSSSGERSKPVSPVRVETVEVVER